MYTEYRPGEGIATTPQGWAENFRASRKLNWKSALAIRQDFRLKLIRQFIRPRGRILDAGCGFGEWVAYLNRLGYEAEGLDYSPELIGRLRETYPALRFTQGATQRMPFPAETFEGIISWGVIEHDPRGPAEQLAEFARVLKPRGAAIITVPADTERMREASRLQFPAAHGAFFQHFMTREELRECCEAAHLGIAALGDIPENVPALLAPRWYAHGHPALPLVRIARRLLPPLPGRHGMIYAVGVKH